MATQTSDTAMALMERVAYDRLRRFNHISAIAEESESPLWRKLAERSARSALRDYLVVGMAQRAADDLAPDQIASEAA